MLQDILIFLAEVVVTLIGGACLVRMLMRWRRMSMANPVGRLVRALTDWLVLTLQRVLPAGGRFDGASLLAAWVLKTAQYALLLGLIGLPRWGLLPVLGALGTLRLAVSVATALVIVAAVLSWTGQRTLLVDVLQSLAEPLLAPFRRLLPLVGGIDLSPLLAIVLLQVAGIVLGSLQAQLVGSAVLVSAG